MSSLVYYSPAKKWTQALPLGNGNTAVMVFGGDRVERLDFNDSEFWSGYPKNHDNANSVKALNKVRELIFNGKYSEANSLVASSMTGNYSEAFMPVGSLKIKFIGTTTSNYSRKLSFDDAIMTINSGNTKRECFVSYPHKVAVYRVSSENRFSLSLSASTKVKGVVDTEKDMLFLHGNAPDYAAPNYLWTKLFPIRYNEGKAMAFTLGVKVQTDGKIVSKSHSIKVENATFVELYSITKTGFNGYDKMPEVDSKKIRKLVRESLIEKFDYEEIKSCHIKDYQDLWSRHSLDLGQKECDGKKLLELAKKGEVKKELIGILYDYGKYMTIQGSRDSQPLNLQGQWNNSVRPPWSSNLTTNINAEMNYWGASRVGLNECIEPFYNAVYEISKRGEATSKTNFGMSGFTCNHNVDIWRNTSPVIGSPSYMYAPTCGVWLANEMYAHKKNTNSIDKKTIEIVESATRFCLDYLTEYKGRLVICPSTSAETTFLANGKSSAVGIASSYDMSLVRQVMKNCLECSGSEELKEKVVKAQEKLYPYTKADNGLSEWADGFMSTEKGHRHFSPLYCVYPGNVVVEGDKEFLWAYELFKYRMAHSHSSIGWSAAWGLCLASKFKDKELANKIIASFTSRSILENLFGYHPPTYFQIDANLGFVAGVNEMFITEDKNTITLLPCAINLVKDGAMRGVVVNGAKIDFSWKNGEVISIVADKEISIKNINLSDNVVTNNVNII